MGAPTATGVVGATLVLVSSAKEDGARMEKARRRLRHCFTIKFSV
jgi:hypothetical protein